MLINKTPTSDGIAIPAGDKIEVKGYDLEGYQAVTFQFLFKGSIGNNGERFFEIDGGGDKDAIYLQRATNDLYVGSDKTSSFFYLSNVFNGYDSNDWMTFAASIGWLGDDGNDDYVLCAYFYQGSSISNCVHVTDFNNDKF
jgi:hypothetical protein